MNEIIEKENIVIEDVIYEIRGVQVMLDSDLAKLYQCANGTKDINKAVKRNINRFPSDFYFQLTDEEKKNCGSNLEPQIICLEQIRLFLLNKVLQCCHQFFILILLKK